MSPADITSAAEFRAGLERRLAEVGLIPAQPAAVVVTALPGSPAKPAGEDLKLLHRGGYEHFRPTSRRRDTAKGKLPVYEWWERTEIAE